MMRPDVTVTVCHTRSVVGLSISPFETRAGSRAEASPLLLAATGSMLEQRLTTCPDAVTVSVPAAVPFSSLRLTGTART
jgi:hypothetical protein